jgi:hypothetical protein
VAELFPPDERRTSFHEAGHALIGLRRELHLEALQMAPLPGMAGGTRFTDSIPQGVQLPASPAVRLYFEQLIDMLVAGDEAALEACGPDDYERAADDLSRARWFASHYVFGDRVDQDAEVDRHRQGVRVALCAEWATVKAIAEALRERRALSADEVHAIIALRGGQC